MSSTSIDIRDARDIDIETIVEFNRRLALETENKTLDVNVLAKGVREIIANRHRGRYFLAEIGEKVVGQISHTTEWSDWRDGEIWWIQSVYVSADARGKGVYTRLHQHVEELARATPRVIGLRLYVEMHNDVARRTYQSLGMTVTPFHFMERLWLDRSPSSAIGTPPPSGVDGASKGPRSEREATDLGRT